MSKHKEDKPNSDAVIEFDSLRWHFAHLLEVSRLSLSHLEFQLKYSKDSQGYEHKLWVESAVSIYRMHFDAIEEEMKRLEGKT